MHSVMLSHLISQLPRYLLPKTQKKEREEEKQKKKNRKINQKKTKTEKKSREKRKTDISNTVRVFSGYELTS